MQSSSVTSDWRVTPASTPPKAAAGWWALRALRGRMTTIGLCLSAVVALTGCGSHPNTLLNPARVDTDFGPSSLAVGSGATPANVRLLAGDLPSANDLRGGSFGEAWKRAAAAGSVCTDKGCDKEPEKTGTGVLNRNTVNRAFLLRGIALSDRLCANWFQELSQNQAKLDFFRSGISDVGSLAAAIMGLTRTASPAIGGVAAVTGFGQSLVSDYEANFIVAPDVGTVQQLVETLRAQNAQLMVAEELTYEDALRKLIAYDNSCSHAAVKRIVNQSMSKASAEFQGYSSSVVTAVLGTLRPLFAVAIDSDVVVALYAVCVGSPSDDEKKALVPILTDKNISDEKCAIPKAALQKNVPPEVVKAILQAAGYKAALEAAMHDRAAALKSASSKPANATAVVPKAPATAAGGKLPGSPTIAPSHLQSQGILPVIH